MSVARPGASMASCRPNMSAFPPPDADAVLAVAGQGDFFAEQGIDLAVQRTRALIAVDIDYAHLPGRDARKGRERANREGLKHAARLIRLAHWGGLVAIDLVGANLNPDAVMTAARSAFDGDGPCSGR